jgi:hypothetical protein
MVGDSSKPPRLAFDLSRRDINLKPVEAAAAERFSLRSGDGF